MDNLAIAERINLALSANDSVVAFRHEKCQLNIVRDFMSAEECAYAIQTISNASAPSTVGNINGFEVSNARQSKTHLFEADNKFGTAIDLRISRLLNTPANHHEVLQGVVYGKGDYFIQHHDYISDDVPQWADEMERGGQRVQSILIYLNDDFDGGGTTFPLLELTVKPMKGMLITWTNINDKGACNPYTLHASTAIEHGEKFVMTTWIRERSFKT
jgi:prolyl 4-hydroxylase